MSDKVREAQEHIKVAERSLKTSLLKWRPDYDTAADEYNQAATCYRVAKSIDKAKECLSKAAFYYKENKSFFHAGKSYEQIILLCKESITPSEIQKLAEQACSLYQQHGMLDSGAAALDKAAKIVEARDPHIALQLYQHAADVVLIEDGYRQACEYLSKTARIMVKLQMYDQAADALRREIGCQQQNEAYQAIGRLTVALVLVQLARGDYVAAEKAFKEWGNYCELPEVQCVESLLQAYDDEDPDGARRALGNPFIRHMDIEYSQLARIVPLPHGISNVGAKETGASDAHQNQEPSYDAQAPSGAARESEDELC